MGKKSDSRFWCKIKNYIAPIGFVVTLIIILTVNLFVGPEGQSFQISLISVYCCMARVK